MAHGSGLKKVLAEKFDDELRFFRGWIDRPKSVGSIVPTSSIAARRMASVVDPHSGLPVLEIGPGLGMVLGTSFSGTLSWRKLEICGRGNEPSGARRASAGMIFSPCRMIQQQRLRLLSSVDHHAAGLTVMTKPS